MSEIEKAKKLFDKWFRGRREDEAAAPQAQPEAQPQPAAQGEELDPRFRGDERVGGAAAGQPSPPVEDPSDQSALTPFGEGDGLDPRSRRDERAGEGAADQPSPPEEAPSEQSAPTPFGHAEELDPRFDGDERAGEATAESLPRPGDAPFEPTPPAPPTADAPPADATAPPPDEEPVAAPEAAPTANWFQRLKQGLTRSSNALTDSLTGLLRKRKLDDETLQDLEDVLIQADLGVETAMRITEALAESRYDKEITAEEVRDVLGGEVERVLAPVAKPIQIERARKPHVVLVVGVNGSGKTTTIGKLAARFRREGLRVVLGAGDTFRAAAIEQLKVWGTRAGAEVVAREQGADASGLAYDALARSKEADADVLILDTAGRLQNKAHLMAELEKIVRVLRKQDDTAPHDVLLVLDATTGQNAMQQVDVFRQVCGVTGLAMTKLDGTARGGILVAIAAKHALPVHFIGVGEGVDDLQPFEAADFARAIAGRTA